MMKPQLLIRPDSFLSDCFYWYPFNHASEETGIKRISAEQLTTLNAHPLSQAVCLLIPSCEIVCRSFDVMAKNRRKLMSLIHWRAQASVLGDQQLEWYLMKQNAQSVDVIGINKEKLARWLKLCNDAGLTVTRLIPDALLLPFNPSEMSLIATGESWIIRAQEYRFNEIQPALLPEFLAENSARHARFLSAPPTALGAEGISQNTAGWGALASSMGQLEINLLAPSTSATGALFTPGNLVCLGFALLLTGAMFIALQLFILFALDRSMENVQQETLTLYQRYFPDKKIRGNVKYQFLQNIKNAPPSLRQLLLKLEQVRSTTPGLYFDQMVLVHSPFSYTISITVASDEVFAAVSAALSGWDKADVSIEREGHQGKIIFRERSE